MKIAIMTSGGDAPGMNAFIRSAVRKCLEMGHEPFGIYNGYCGLINAEIKAMDYDSVCNIIQRGGTILKTSRCNEFFTIEGRNKAAKVLDSFGIQALLCCGGDGSYAGLHEFAKASGQWSGQAIGVPGTIDNDVRYTDYTIGFDTAINTATEAIDKLRDTGDSNSMHFIVEVMGRRADDIAVAVGTASAASYVLSPQTPLDLDLINKFIRSHGHTIIILAEGHPVGGAHKLGVLLQEKWCDKEICKPNFRICVLGHIQRGGSPTAKDRILAHEMTEFGIEQISQGASLKAVAVQNGKYLLTELIY